MRSLPRLVPVLLYACMALASPDVMLAAEGDGLAVSQRQAVWPRWQARIGSSLADNTRSSSSVSWQDSPSAHPSFTLMGDYYLTGPWLGQSTSGGLRATSGVLLGGSRRGLNGQWVGGVGSTAGLGLTAERRGLYGTPTSFTTGLSSRDANSTPYLGIGYTGISARGGWSFSADVGLLALNPEPRVRLGRAFNGTQNVDDLLQEIRLTPVLQLGVSYSF